MALRAGRTVIVDARARKTGGAGRRSRLSRRDKALSFTGHLARSAARGDAGEGGQAGKAMSQTRRRLWSTSSLRYEIGPQSFAVIDAGLATRSRRRVLSRARLRLARRQACGP